MAVLSKNLISEINVTNDANKAQVLQVINESEPIITGHYRLKYGGHTNRFIQVSKIAAKPWRIRVIADEIAKHFSSMAIHKVMVMALPGAMSLAFSLVDQLRPSSFNVLLGRSVEYVLADVDSQGYPSDLREGFHIKPNEKILVATDVITTGKGAERLADIVTKHKGEVVGIASFANRGMVSDEELADRAGLSKDRIISLVHFTLDHYEAGADGKCAECPKEGPSAARDYY